MAFRVRSKPIDWSLIAKGRAVGDIVIDTSDLASKDIQFHLENIAFGQCSGLPSDSALTIKGLQYAQLTIEYLLHVQETLSFALQRAHDVAEEVRVRSEEALSDVNKRELKARRKSEAKLLDCQTTLRYTFKIKSFTYSLTSPSFTL